VKEQENDKNAFGSDALDQGLQTFLYDDHISCYTKVQRPDILRNVIVLVYIAFYEANKFFVNILFFHYG